MERYYISSNKYSLQERKDSKGKTVYDCVFRIITMDGDYKQKWIRGSATKTLAKQRYLEFVEEYCEVVKKNPFRQKNASKEVLLVGDLFRKYIGTLGNQNKQSVIYCKNNIFRIYILPRFNDTPIDKLTKEALYLWQDELWASKNKRTGDFFSYKYLLSVRGHFSAFLSWVEQRYGYKNNLAEVIKPKRRQPKQEMKFWTKEQFEQFIAVVDDPTYHALFTFMFYTGRRKGELFALYKTDVKADKITFDKSVSRRTFGTGTWEITSTKAEKTCTLPVCKIVQKEIKTYKPPQEGKFYFSGEEPLPSTTVERFFKKYVAIAGVPIIRMHDLRHSFVSMLLHYGANFMVVAELISDTVEQVTKTYAHVYQQDCVSVLNKIC